MNKPPARFLASEDGRRPEPDVVEHVSITDSRSKPLDLDRVAEVVRVTRRDRLDGDNIAVR